MHRGMPTPVIDRIHQTDVYQDPFETDFNVARCVTKDGLYTVSD